jgi:hypothetical protein
MEYLTDYMFYMCCKSGTLVDIKFAMYINDGCHHIAGNENRSGESGIISVIYNFV